MYFDRQKATLTSMSDYHDRPRCLLTTSCSSKINIPTAGKMTDSRHSDARNTAVKIPNYRVL